ncbi:MAG: hypothetical protein MI919_17250, partial [Holophagales bacterium]|nr:hypothetical protein [Holophagales bacterium]
MKLSTIVILGLSAVAGAQAATIQVDGTCTLADAIVAANSDSATGACPAGDPGADTVLLDVAVSLSAADPA